MDTNNLSPRRTFLKHAGKMAMALPLLRSVNHLPLTFPKSDLKVYIFSKHLQFLNFTDLAKAAKEMGFDGVDLTVRPGGHIAPKEVDKLLPQAVEALRYQNLSADMMTTAIERADDPVDRQVLESAASAGIKYYRMNWYSYLENKSIPESISFYQKQLSSLAELNQQLGLTGCYQNHAGERMGASIWEVWEMLKEVQTEALGVQYDIRHATVEGGLSWKSGLRLIQPQIRTLVIKDFRWVEDHGQWKVQNTPLGEGMVDFSTYFKLLKEYQIQVPVCLHMEYDLGGAEHGSSDITNKQQVYQAMERDLSTLRQMWQSAEG